MAKFTAKHYRNKDAAGMTLLEVLIAMAIMSIALTAVIKTTTQNIRETSYLQKKSMAHWVALEIINKARIGILKLPVKPEMQEEETTILGELWYWQGYQVKSANPHIREIHISAGLTADQPLSTLIGYTYVAEEK